MLRLFVGYDPREEIGLHVFNASVWRHASAPVSITPIGANVCGTDGTNAFSLARFHVPRLCNYQGWALFMDGSDMLMLDDVAKLWALRDEKYAVQVVKHDYTPRAARKYIGTEMEAANEPYPRKNWSSVILWNCGHGSNHGLLGETRWHRFSWLADDLIGALPNEWNYLVDEDGQCRLQDAKVAHWTNGGPWFPYYGSTVFANLWRDEYRRCIA